jgi:hypothetical protein
LFCSVIAISKAIRAKVGMDDSFLWLLRLRHACPEFSCALSRESCGDRVAPALERFD